MIMGYRSDVMLFATERIADQVLEEAKKHSFLPGIVRKSVDGLYAIGWEWVKWYGSFPEIKAILKVLDEADEQKHEMESEELDYKLIEIGEDNCTNERVIDGGSDIDAGIEVRICGYEDMEEVNV